jgi:uncharacterized membrane protein
MRRVRRALIFATAGWSAIAVAAENPARLERECARVTEVYPLLMLAAMAEGPMDCGDPDSGVQVDCAAAETPAERAAHARRYAIRQYQEAAYKTADEACGAWRASRDAVPLQDAASHAIAAARATDNGRLPEAQR